jgi:hypothetical protein
MTRRDSRLVRLFALLPVILLIVSGMADAAIVTIKPPYPAGSIVTTWNPITTQTGTAVMFWPTAPYGLTATGLASFDEHANAGGNGTAKSDSTYVNISVPASFSCYPFCGTLHTWSLIDNWTVNYFLRADAYRCNGTGSATATLSLRAAATSAHGSGSTVTVTLASLSTSTTNLSTRGTITKSVVHTYSATFPGPNVPTNFVTITFEASVVGFTYATCRNPGWGSGFAEVDLSNFGNAYLNWISVT